MRLAERRNITSNQIEAGAGGRKSTQWPIRITPIRRYNLATVFYDIT